MTPPDEKNPFYPDVERVPLRLVLDARSFERLQGEARERAHVLCELCWTKAIDALWSWEGEPIEGNIPRTELRPVQNNARAVGRRDEPPHCFIGGVFAWDQFARWADQQGYGGAERDWFVHYGSLAHFSNRNANYLVSADERLLEEAKGEQGWFRKGRHRIISIRHALFVAGLVMKAHREIFYESPQPGHTIYTTSHSIYEWLAMDLVQSPRRLFDCLKASGETPEDFYRSEREALAESVFDRVADLLQARDRISLANARSQDEGTLNEMRYDLASMIGSAAAVLDTIAVMAHIAFPFDLRPGAGDAAISLRRSDFRKGLRGAGAVKLAEAASALAPYMNFVWGLRNPLLHRGGLPGYNLHVLGAGKEPQISLSENQVALLKELCGHRGEATEMWGLEASGFGPSIKPMPFGHRLALVTIGAVNELLGAFASDRGIERPDSPWTGEQRQMLRRFRWLSGIPDEL